MIVLLVGLLTAVGYEMVRGGDIDCVQTSISAYYYTHAQAIFVGALIAIGTCLIGRGPRKAESLQIRAVSALGQWDLHRRDALEVAGTDAPSDGNDPQQSRSDHCCIGRGGNGGEQLRVFVSFRGERRRDLSHATLMAV